MFVHLGQRIRTNFLTGTIVQRIDGRKRKFWKPTLYLVVRVEKPTAAAGTEHIVRWDEVTSVDK